MWESQTCGLEKHCAGLLRPAPLQLHHPQQTSLAATPNPEQERCPCTPEDPSCSPGTDRSCCCHALCSLLHRPSPASVPCTDSASLGLVRPAEHASLASSAHNRTNCRRALCSLLRCSRAPLASKLLLLAAFDARSQAHAPARNAADPTHKQAHAPAPSPSSQTALIHPSVDSSMAEGMCARNPISDASSPSQANVTAVTAALPGRTVSEMYSQFEHAATPVDMTAAGRSVSSPVVSRLASQYSSIAEEFAAIGSRLVASNGGGTRLVKRRWEEEEDVEESPGAGFHESAAGVEGLKHIRRKSEAQQWTRHEACLQEELEHPATPSAAGENVALPSYRRVFQEGLRTSLACVEQGSGVWILGTWVPVDS